MMMEGRTDLNRSEEAFDGENRHELSIKPPHIVVIFFSTPSHKDSNKTSIGGLQAPPKATAFVARGTHSNGMPRQGSAQRRHKEACRRVRGVSYIGPGPGCKRTMGICSGRDEIGRAHV